MQSLNKLFALFFATSLVAASPVDFQKFEKRRDVEVVWVTATSTDYVTISTQTQFTQTVTVQDSQSSSAGSSGGNPVSSVADPAVQDPVAPAIASATTTSADPPAASETPDPAPAATDPPATTADPPAATPTTAATPVEANASSSDSENPPVGVMYSGQGTYFSPGYAIILFNLLLTSYSVWEPVVITTPIKISSVP